MLGELDHALREPADAPLTRDQAAVPANRAKRRTLVRVALAAVGTGILVAGSFGVRGALQPRPEPAVFSSSARPLVVVSELRPQGDPRVAATFGELLSAQLGVGDAMRLPAPDARVAMLEASGLAAGRLIDPAGLARLHAATGADVVIGGELETTAATLRATIELHDARHGTRLGAFTLTAPADRLTALVREASARVRRGLARPALSVEDETVQRSILPEDAAASTAYVEGLVARRAFQFRAAVTQFERVIGLVPTFAPAFSALAHARLMLGDQVAARDAAARAVRLAPALPRGDELLVYALAAETRHDWAAAVEHYRALAQFYPDRIDHVTSLARALVGAGKARDAVALLHTTKQQPQSDWDLVRIHLMAAFAHARLSEDPASIAAAKEAERLAIEIGARVPAADAMLAQAHAHHRAGRLDEAAALFDRARAIYADVGDTDNLLNSDTALAEIAGVRGDFARAIAICERIVRGTRASGNLYRRARVTTTLCIFHASADRSRRPARCASRWAPLHGGR